MVDLWKQQAHAHINSHPSPRNDAVTALLKLTEYEEDGRKRKNFEDRGADTMLDGYTTTDQIRCMAKFFWNNFREPSTSLRNLLAFLLSHYTLMRGEASRKMELADMHSLNLKNEGYSSCRAVVLVMRRGKTNQVGRIEFGACMRHKAVELCPHGLLASYLFWRWHIDLEPFPDFTTSNQWYPLKLLKTGKNPRSEMSYKVHRDAIAAALKSIGIQSTAKTHIGRGSGARMADLGGASEAQIRQLGRWNNHVMEKCYLTSLPREAMRTLAVFEPARGSFFLPRAHVEPPMSLQSQVFPQVEMWQRSLSDGTCEQTIAAGGFLELLQYLRVVLLQDAVFMSDWMPEHPIWQHKLFMSTEFQQFKEEAKLIVNTMDNPSEHRLQKGMPVLQAKLDGVHQDLKLSVDKISSTLQAVETNVAGVMRSLIPLTNGSALLQVQLVPQGTASTTTTAINENAGSSSGESRSRTPEFYKMSRCLLLVSELWNEWSVGLNGGSSVKELETKYGTKWCSADERRFYNRR